jgi:dephospho-CoA kinase
MLLGVTGGIASGKSTFRRLLTAKHKFTVFDADESVHDLLAKDERVISAIRTHFGDSVLNFDGGINRPALREAVFTDNKLRKQLEEIIHPVVRHQWQLLRQSCMAKNMDFLAEIPLLFETSAENFFDATILVATSTPVQQVRLAARGLSPQIAQAMLASQCPMGEKEKRATVVVWNDGSLIGLEQQARMLIERLFPSPT